MKKILQKALCFALFCCLALGIKSNVNAAEVYATTLATNDTWVSGEISEAGEVDYYQVTIPTSGWLTVDYQGFSIGDSYVKIYDNDLTKEYASYNLYTTSDVSPKNKTFNLALEAGVYKIKIYGYNNYHVGSYRLKSSFVTSGSTVYGANGFATAYALSYGKTVTGFLSEDDNLDFYKVTVPASQTAIFYYTSYIGDSYFELYDEDLISQSRKNVYTASESNPKTYVHEVVLQPGTYYVKIYPYNNGYRGRYQLKCESKVLVSNITISGPSGNKIVAGKTTKLKATIGPSKATDKSIKWSVADGNTASVRIDSETGAVTTYANSCGKATFVATAQDGSGTSKKYTLIVTPSKMNKPYVSNYYTKKMYVSWNSHSGATGYQVQYSTNKNMKNAVTKKVSAKNTYKYYKVKKGKKYYVRVRSYYKTGGKTYYGAWSSKAKIKITR